MGSASIGELPNSNKNSKTNCLFKVSEAMSLTISRDHDSISLPSKLISLLQRPKTPSQILQIQAHLIITGLISNTFAASRLIVTISTSSSPPNMAYAELVFSHLPHPNSFIYSTIIRGHAAGPTPLQGLVFYRRMRRDGVPGDNHTYPFVLKACGLALELEESRRVHGEVVKRGFYEDLFVGNGLISKYCRCGEVDSGKVFDEIPERDLVSWNSMVGGYAILGKMGEAQGLFDEMPERDRCFHLGDHD